VDEYLKISEIDYILLENRGIMEEFLKYGKPLVVGGPIASQMIDEVEFMYRSTSKGFHPSTNLVGECAYTKTAGYEYSSRLQTFVDGITAWNLEPGNMLSVTNLPAMKTNGNNPPELKWNGTPPYTLDGTNPDTLKAGQKMSFCFKYIDIDDTPPQRNEVWIDVNCNGVFSPDERLPMNRCQGTSYKKGVVFIKDNVSIPVNKTTQIKYCFYFTDSYYSPPAGEASGIHTFYVVKN
jgi:hypothetical protein